MSDLDVGKRALRHNEHGEDVPCEIVEYKAGRDAGDHLLFGGTTSTEQGAGAGDVFHAWSQVGDKSGQFTVKH